MRKALIALGMLFVVWRFLPDQPVAAEAQRRVVLPKCAASVRRAMRLHILRRAGGDDLVPAGRHRPEGVARRPEDGQHHALLGDDEAGAGLGSASESVAGDGVFSAEKPKGDEPSDSYRSDPLDPVPTRGGPICCTNDPAQVQGMVDQAAVEPSISMRLRDSTRSD